MINALILLLLLLLSRISCVWLLATPWTAAHQVPPSMGFSRQEHWGGLPFPSPMNESESEVALLCPTLSDPMDCSPPGSSIHGISQARVLEWGAVAFSSYGLSCCYFQLLSPVWLSVTPWTAARQASLSFTISRSLLKFTSIELVMPSSHFFFCLPPSPPALNLSQHQDLFQWVGPLHQVTKVLELPF